MLSTQIPGKWMHKSSALLKSRVDSEKKKKHLLSHPMEILARSTPQWTAWNMWRALYLGMLLKFSHLSIFWTSSISVLSLPWLHFLKKNNNLIESFIQAQLVIVSSDHSHLLFPGDNCILNSLSFFELYLSELIKRQQGKRGRILSCALFLQYLSIHMSILVT